ncbi:FMN-binding negative transcriptional regulator [Seohaeicola zhoushanensis]|uniref:Transcriptional regulator n=1 Tax=Seohaeicola zhoushanensis TaxID=1569283 RepID=A0A8J3M407_9RHOB|nr:FMN-binding negative transcriptional regulator [Seohaeicola zhoushanensis]GHF33029.1 transcriptional regulator [Seohaeicola zhoushanensis]
MHPNPIYHTADAAKNLAYARARAFGTLSVATPEGPLVSHVPFLLSDDGTTAELHLVRSNPIARALKAPLNAILAISGPDSYISPDWYGMENQVPTWNYVAVHLKGKLTLQPQEGMRDLLDRQSAAYEERLLPKTPWTMDKVDPEAVDKLLRMIVPCKLSITGVDGTWKFSQNKPETARLGAADGAGAAGFGAEVALLAQMMRDA